MIQTHHQRVIDRLVERFVNDPRFEAVIIAGSVMTGRAREASDIDIFLVATPKEWAHREPAHDIFYYTEELSDYPGGYVDGKIVDITFLRDTAERGSEPLRAAFQDAMPICSRNPEIVELLPRISVYPTEEQAVKMSAFYSQVVVLCDYITPDYATRNGVYVVAQAAAQMAHYGGRLLLAYNKSLYPGLKWFTRVLTEVPDKPADFLPLMEALMTEPTQANARAFRDCIIGFRDWGLTFPQAIVRFIEDVEWHWRRGNPYVFNW